MKHSDDWLIVGRFGRPYGIKGYITIHSFTEPEDNLVKYTGWHVLRNNQWELLHIGDIKTYHKRIVVRLENISAPEEASILTNLDIAIRKETLPALSGNEYYWHQLLDTQVVTTNGFDLGKVKDIIPTGAHDVLSVVGERKRLIPYLWEKVIKEVDLDRNTIIVDWDPDF